MIIVNKITAQINETGECEIKLYRTKNLITTFTNVEISVPNAEAMEGVNKSQYIEYCKAIVMNLLENGGLSHGGIKLLWQPKEKTDALKLGSAIELAKGDLIHRLFEMGFEDVKVLKTITLDDKNSKNGSLNEAKIIMTTLINGATFRVQTEVKSCQLTKPRLIRLQDSDHDVKFNVTNIKSLLK